MNIYAKPPLNVISSSFKKLIPFSSYNENVVRFLKSKKISYNLVGIKVNELVKTWIYVDSLKIVKALSYYSIHHELNVINLKLCFVYKNSKVNYFN